MNKKVFDFSVLAVSLIIIGILFSACGIGNIVDPSKSTTDPESIAGENSTDPTDTTEVQFGLRDCFVANDDPSVIEYLGSYDCIPGYVYFRKEVYGEIKQLFEKKSKLADIAELVSKVYVVTEDNEVVKINKEDGMYETVYKPQYGSIYELTYNPYYSKYLLFNDGDYIVKFNPINDEYSIATQSNNGISRIYGSGGDFDERGFYCKDCNEEYVVWEDADYNTYWYHPETDTNEKIDWSGLCFGHPEIIE